MTLLSRLKISTKIIGLLMLLGALTVGIGWYASVPLLQADTAYSQITNQSFPVGVRAGRLVQAANEMVYAGYRAIAYDGAAPEARQASKDERQAYEFAQKNMHEAAALDPALAARFAAAGGKMDELHAATAEATRLGALNRNAQAIVALANADTLVNAITTDMRSLNNDKLETALALSDRLSSKAAATSWWLLGLSVAGVVAAIGGSLVVSRIGITGPLDRLKAAMLLLAAGNNNTEIPGADRGDEIGDMAKVVLGFREAARKLEAMMAGIVESQAEQKMVVDVVSTNLASLAEGDVSNQISADFPTAFMGLKNNFNAALLKLRDLIGGVTESADGIRAGSDEIAQASEDLARRTEGNAASLEETSAALMQIESRLRVTATASQGTVARADQAITSVGTGRSTAEAAMQAMTRVSGSAKGIDDVIEGLDKIAFQTRVLAMNAAVEAGRAGDAGRGFAVVADLVSALAMRAEEEAKRARDQLSVTQTEIATAVDAVQKVDGAFSDISTNVDEVHKLLASMAEDNQAQSAAITQISSAVGDMDKATQQNAAMVEETSAAARTMTVKVAALAEQAAQFKTGGARSTGSSARRADGGVPSPKHSPSAAPRRVAAAPGSGKVHASAHDNWSSF